MSLIRDVAILLLVLAFGALGRAQQSEPCLKRTVIVNARDRDGRLVSGLTPPSFRANFHRKPLKILASQQQSIPYRVVLLLDGSASMSQSRSTWNLLQEVAGDFLSRPPKNARIATALFGSKIESSLDFSHSPSETLNQLRASPDGRKIIGKGEKQTALFDSILYALRMLGDPQPGDAVFAITDGNDTASKASQQDVERQLSARGVRFFAFFVTQVNLPSKDGRSPSAVLRDLAMESGGALLDIPDESATLILYDSSAKGQEAMRVQLAYLYDLMSHYYRLQIELPRVPATASTWDLDVVDEHGKIRRDVEIFYPRELTSCSTLPASR